MAPRVCTLVLSSSSGMYVIMNRNIITLRNTLSYAGVFVVNGAGAWLLYVCVERAVSYCSRLSVSRSKARL